MASLCNCTRQQLAVRENMIVENVIASVNTSSREHAGTAMMCVCVCVSE